MNTKRYDANDEDINNVEAWAEVLGRIIYHIPHELRIKVLELAVSNEQQDEAKRQKNGLFMKFDNEAMEEFNKSAYVRHYGAHNRLTALAVQILVRDITNNHSPADASKLLFTYHKFGTGSRYLADYLKGLPRK